MVWRAAYVQKMYHAKAVAKTALWNSAGARMRNGAKTENVQLQMSLRDAICAMIADVERDY